VRVGASLLGSWRALRAGGGPPVARRLGAVVLAAALTATVAGTAAATASARGAHASRGVRTYSTRGTLPLRTSLFDPFAFASPEYATAFRMTRAAGASYVRLVVMWNGIVSADPPAGFDASDPASPEYSWGWLDGIVAAAEAAGLTPILDVGAAPGWAAQRTAGGRPVSAPKPRDLAQFATALATHYDGLHGAPPVHVFQVWNEPNLSLDLSPVSGAVYRAMVNAFADAVHAVNPANIVVAGGLDPFANKTRAWHTQAPLAFMRAMLCLSKGAHPHATCHASVHFDVWAHHPYTFGGPFGHAKRPDDVSLGDLPKMRALLQAAVKLHHVVSARPVQFWVTEFGWDSKPPRPHAAPLALAARWTAESLYQMWRSGVTLVTWFGFQDKASPSPYQSGLYFHSKQLARAKPKPVLTAFRFPFVAYLGKRTVSVWGRDATSTKTLVTIQRAHRQRGPWRTVARIRTNRYGIFKAALRLAATKRDWLRATAPGSGKSLPFSLTVPKAPHVGPWGN